MTDKCIECENDALLKYADLQIELDKANRYNELLQKCLDVKEELNATLRRNNQILKEKLEVLND